MKSISSALTISLITFFMLETTAVSFLLPSITFEPALAQTEASTQEDENNSNNLDNNTIAYSYNIYSNNNTQQAPTRLHNGYLTIMTTRQDILSTPSSANNTQQQQQIAEPMPAVIMIHEWWGLR